MLTSSSTTFEPLRKKNKQRENERRGKMILDIILSSNKIKVMPCYNLCWTLGEIQSLCRSMVGWKAFGLGHMNLPLAMSPLEQKMRQTNEIKLRGKEKKIEKELKTRNGSKLTKLYIITYIENKSIKTILITHYEKMKNKIKIRIEVAKDSHSRNHSKNLKKK